MICDKSTRVVTMARNDGANARNSMCLVPRRIGAVLSENILKCSISTCEIPRRLMAANHQ